MSRVEDVKVWVGAVSRNVVRVADYCALAGLPVGVIATPNEVSYGGGYLDWDNDALYENTQNTPLGRDHGNHLPWLLVDRDTYGTIHIDDTARTRKFMERLCAENPCGAFEVGQEERKQRYDTLWLATFLDTLDLRGVVYAVVQSGLSLKGDECVGEFDEKRLTDMCKVCHRYGIKAKMHNADFMSPDMLKRHVDCGVDSFNVGPELAAIEAKIYDSKGTSEDRYVFEKQGIREEHEEKRGVEIRETIRWRIEEIVEAVS